MDIQTIPYTTVNGVTTRNTLWTPDSATVKLLVMLPGRGYTLKNPLLHLLAMMGVQHGYAVYGVEYGFHASGAPPDRSAITQIGNEAHANVLDFVGKREYAQVVLAGKSLGTGFITGMHEVLPHVAAHLMLTPVPGAVPAADVPTLAVVGTADPFYDALSDVIADPPAQVQWQIVSGADHSMETGAWRTSLDTLREALAACETFLERFSK